MQRLAPTLLVVMFLGCRSSAPADPVQSVPEPEVSRQDVEPPADPDVVGSRPEEPEVESKLAEPGAKLPPSLTESTELVMSPRLLVLVFGPPLFRETYESSGEYVFTHGEMVFRVRDPGLTTLTKKCGLAPHELWMSDHPVAFAVTGNSEVEPFVHWIIARTAAAIREEQKQAFQDADNLLAHWAAGDFEPKHVEAEMKKLAAAWKLDAYPPNSLAGPQFAPGADSRSSMADTWRQRKGAPCAGESKAAKAPYPAHDPRSILLEVADLMGNASKTLTEDDIAPLQEFLSPVPGTEARAWLEWKAYRKKH